LHRYYVEIKKKQCTGDTHTCKDLAVYTVTEKLLIIQGCLRNKAFYRLYLTIWAAG